MVIKAKYDVISLIQLIRSENIGPQTFSSLLSLYKEPQKAIEAIPELARKGGSPKNIKLCKRVEAEREYERTKKAKADIITIFDDAYPKLLKHIYNPPPILTYKGRKEILGKKVIAIVGSRNASINGCKFAYKIAQELTGQNIAVASGLARGIDTAVHKGSMPDSIAVIAGGIDNFYPPENKALQEKLSDEGVVITENSYGAVPKGKNFPQRNRIISGISMAILVVEASFGSGSLITARMALEQNRQLFAVPGFPLDPRSAGTNKLIQDGAVLVTRYEDIIDNLYNTLHDTENNLSENSGPDFRSKGISHPSEDELVKAREEIISLIGTGAISVGEIISYTNLGYNVVLMVILELELAGRIERSFGDKISLIH